MTRRVLAVLPAVLAVQLVYAHAVLVEATPTANGRISGPDFVIHLRFNSRIDAARSRLTLVLPDQSLRPLGLDPAPAPATLDARAVGLRPGEYKLRWQVLAADGHITRGEFPFHVQ
jgi:methionine-rich copper-binding protein CopC